MVAIVRFERVNSVGSSAQSPHPARSCGTERWSGDADEGAAVIVVTHDGEFASACADRLITLTPTGATCAREGDHQ